MGPDDANREVVLRYVAAWNRRDVPTLRALFAPDAEIHGVLGTGTVDVAEPIWRELWAAFANELIVDDVVVDGDRVAVRYTERGRFVSAFRGHAPTGKAFELVAMEWFVVHDGRIRRRWAARDSAAQARQMGMALT
jgi:steroid delta-isomerase-like uncharacterized protein